MKLRIINEIFDRPTMTGVQVLEKPNGSVYAFRDPTAQSELARNTVYIVKIRQLHDAKTDNIKPPPMIHYVRKHAENNEVLRNMLTTLSPMVAIDLEANKDNDRTNYGNQYFVYGKLIACVWDYIKKNKPIGLFAMGVDSDMDIMYNKFIKLGNKLDPSNEYVLFGQDNYIRKEVADLITNYEPERRQHIRSVQKRFAEIKAEKNAERNTPARRDFD